MCSLGPAAAYNASAETRNTAMGSFLIAMHLFPLHCKVLPFAKEKLWAKCPRWTAAGSLQDEVFPLPSAGTGVRGSLTVGSSTL